MPGYERTRIVGVSEIELDEFTCGICLAIFNNPLVTKCCRQTFCKDCITEWLSANKNCPNDRKSMNTKHLSPVPRLLINLMENMKIKCNFQSEGCQQVVTIGELAQHLCVCEFRPNQLCQTCGLIKESVLTHNCIQSLIYEKQKIDKKYLNLLDENSALLLIRRERDETIAALRQNMSHMKALHQSTNDKLKAENSRTLKILKSSYTKVYEELRDYQTDELDQFKSMISERDHFIKYLKLDLNAYKSCLKSTEISLKSKIDENETLRKKIKSIESSRSIVFKALVIITGIYLFQYFWSQ